jgi:hypothetical protein
MRKVKNFFKKYETILKMVLTMIQILIEILKK